MADDKQIRLIVDPATRKVLDKRRLSDEDIRQALSIAEETGKKFVHPETCRFLAGARLGKVTVWVEYGIRDDGFEIFTAYQHRVEIAAWDFKTGRTR